MTTGVMEKKIAALEADIRELKKAVGANAATHAAREAARARLRAEVLKGLNSGEGKPIDAAYWKRLRALVARHAKKKA